MKDEEFIKEEYDEGTGRTKLILDMDKVKSSLVKEVEIVQIKDEVKGISIDLLSRSFDVKQLSRLAIRNFDLLLKRRENKTSTMHG